MVLPLYFGTLADFHATAAAWSLASFCKLLEGIATSDFVLMRRTQLVYTAAALRLQRYVWASSTLPYDIIWKFLLVEIVPKVPAPGEGLITKDGLPWGYEYLNNHTGYFEFECSK